MRSIGVLKNGGLKAAYVIRATYFRLFPPHRPMVTLSSCEITSSA